MIVLFFPMNTIGTFGHTDPMMLVNGRRPFIIHGPCRGCIGHPLHRITLVGGILIDTTTRTTIPIRTGCGCCGRCGYRSGYDTRTTFVPSESIFGYGIGNDFLFRLFHHGTIVHDKCLSGCIGRFIHNNFGPSTI